MVGQFGQFLDADPGVPQHLHHRPGPEPAVFFEAEVPAPSGVGVLGPDTAGGLGLQHRPAQGLPPAAVNSSPGWLCSAAASSSAVRARSAATQATSVGSTGSRSRVR